LTVLDSAATVSSGGFEMGFWPLVVGLVGAFFVALSPLPTMMRRLLLAIIVLTLMHGPYRSPIERWGWSIARTSVESVTSGNEFTAGTILLRTRRVVLFNTEIPPNPQAAAQAKRALEQLIGGQTVFVEPSVPGTATREPWPVRVRAGSVDVNEVMVRNGHLRGASTSAENRPLPVGQAPPIEAADTHQSGPDPSKKTSGWPLATRLLIWIPVGLFGASALGMTLNRRRGALFLLLVVTGSVLYALWDAWKEGISLVPPALALLLILLLGGWAAKSNRQLEEMKQRADAHFR